MARKAAGKAATTNGGATLPARVAHRIESLLHTMRVIERHEEQLCVLMTEIRNTGVVSGAVRKELHDLLEELPADAYRLDMEAVSIALLTTDGPETSSVKTGRRPGAKKSVRPAGKAVAKR